MATFAVIGKPILHSLSPVIQLAAMRAAGIKGSYLRLAVDSVIEAIQLCKEIGIEGLNVTAPFKEEAAQVAHILDEDSKQLQAANTLRIQGNSISAYNTDTYGVYQALQTSGIEIKKKRALVLGAGGAAKAAALGLMNAGATVCIANRTIEKAKKLGGELGCSYCDLSQTSLQKAVEESQIIISTLPLSADYIQALSPSHVVFDAIYKVETPLARAAEKAGATLIPGAQWLIHQGIKSFEIFTKKNVSHYVMHDALQETVRKKPKRISLIGMMGSGKTTLGKVLAQKLSMPFYDLDNELERDIGMTIPECIKTKGEPFFREVESKILNKYFTEHVGIFACGGGAILSSDNRALLKAQSLPILFWSSAPTLASRVEGDPHRPLLDGGDVTGKIQSLLKVRKDLYLEASELVISTEIPEEEKITERLMYEINSTWPF